MMKAPAIVWVLFLVDCQSSHLRLGDSGSNAIESGTREGESCRDLQTDNNNCGQCGNVCSAIEPSTSQCVMGRCLTTLFSQNIVTSVVVASAGVYWLGNLPMADGGSVTALWKTGLAGGAPRVLTKCGFCPGAPRIGSTEIVCTPLSMDASNLYCFTSDSSSYPINKVPLDGSSEATFLARGDYTEDVALDASNIYWSTCYRDPGDPGGFVGRAPLAGGGKPNDVVWNGSYCPSNLVWHGSSLYWRGKEPTLRQDTDYLMKVSVNNDGAKTAPFLPWSKDWGRFVIGDAAIYWTDPDQGALMAFPLEGGSSPSVIMTDLDSPRDLAVDAGNLYWASYDGGQIMKLSFADGALATLATGQSRPHGIVVDANSVYWISTDGGRDTVMKASPK